MIWLYLWAARAIEGGHSARPVQSYREMEGGHELESYRALGAEWEKGQNRSPQNQDGGWSSEKNTLRLFPVEFCSV